MIFSPDPPTLADNPNENETAISAARKLSTILSKNRKNLVSSRLTIDQHTSSSPHTTLSRSHYPVFEQSSSRIPLATKETNINMKAPDLTSSSTLELEPIALTSIASHSPPLKGFDSSSSASPNPNNASENVSFAPSHKLSQSSLAASPSPSPKDELGSSGGVDEPLPPPPPAPKLSQPSRSSIVSSVSAYKLSSSSSPDEVMKSSTALPSPPDSVQQQSSTSLPIRSHAYEDDSSDANDDMSRIHPFFSTFDGVNPDDGISLSMTLRSQF